MRNYNLLKSILSEPWFISPEDARGLGHLLLAVLRPEQPSMGEKTPDDLVRTFYAVNVSRGNTSVIDKIGVVEITGVMNKYDPDCAYGMESYGRFFRMHEQDPTVRAIVARIDSPGASVPGLEELGEIVKTCSKPVVAFISDMACSGGYWLACNCREIFANNTTARIGSIGCMSQYVDMSKYYEKQGVRIHDIYAPQSKDKNEESRAVVKGDYSLTKERLKAYADKFQAIVRENRPGVLDEQLTGKVYFARDVVGSLIDRIGTIEQALTRAAELADEMESAGAGSATSAHHQTSDNMSKQVTMLVALAAAAGVANFETADGSITLTAEQAGAVDKVLQGLAKQATDNAQIVADLATARETISAREARIAELESKPGAEHSSVGKETDAHSNNGGGETSFLDAFHANLAFLNGFNDSDDKE